MVRTQDISGGLFAALFPGASRDDVFATMQHALSGLQHRGQDGLGWVFLDVEGRYETFTGRGQVSQWMSEDARLSPRASSPTDHALKERIVAVVATTQQLQKTIPHTHQQSPFLETLSSGEKLIWAWNGHMVVDLAKWWEDSSGTLPERLKDLPGAFALIGLWKDTLFLMRDAHGVKPLFYGWLNDKVLVASETSVLTHLGADRIETVRPGELVTLNLSFNDQGKRFFPQRLPLVGVPSPQLCAFEAIYYSRTDAKLYEKSVYALRKRMGEKLAEAYVPEADVVIGVPDSGTAAAIGYAQKSGYPLEMGLVKNRYVGRTFIQTTQAARERGVRQKLSVIEEVVRDRRVILVDDSIVRGTTARWNVELLKDAGAREVHLRISAPPVRAACPFDLLGTTEAELFFTSVHLKTRERHPLAEHFFADVPSEAVLRSLAASLGADSLYYLPISDFKDVLQSGYCMACFYRQRPEVSNIEQRSDHLTQSIAPSVQQEAPHHV